MTRRWYWKLYLFLLVVLTIGGFGSMFYFSEEATSIERIVQWAGLPMYLVQLVGLFGFVYGRRIGSARAWKLVFAATILDLLWTGYTLTTDIASYVGVIVLTMMVSVSVAIFLPLLVALYLYAFRTEDMWNRVGRRQPA